MQARIFGYARVSSVGQNLDRQLLELEKYVPKENIITDKASGKNFDREGYKALKGALGLRTGDTLFIKSLDRLSRNKQDIKNELCWFKDNGIRLVVLDIPSTNIQIPENQAWILDMINNILIEVLASIAEQERTSIKQRQREGIEAAKKKGKHLGRPALPFPDGWETYYRKWKQGEITANTMMDELSLKRTTFYKLVKEYQA